MADLNEIASNFIYWVMHTSQRNLIAVFVLAVLIVLFILKPRLIIGRAMKRSYKRHDLYRNCQNCHRRIRKGGKGKFCSERCERRSYTKEVRANYKGRKWHRNRLWAISHLCGICRKPIAKLHDATIDHIVPLSKGGTNHPDNLQLAHAGCNAIKGSELLEEIPEDKFNFAI